MLFTNSKGAGPVTRRPLLQMDEDIRDLLIRGVLGATLMIGLICIQQLWAIDPHFALPGDIHIVGGASW